MHTLAIICSMSVMTTITVAISAAFSWWSIGAFVVVCGGSVSALQWCVWVRSVLTSSRATTATASVVASSTSSESVGHCDVFPIGVADVVVE